ncbi:hypothetical protein H9P43_001573 [Blastocladiella emersonii ATCC 22665]|nr:hypothetical protein H9P43_001573 [Blastocladiella emersonii ATCC 22665]
MIGFGSHYSAHVVSALKSTIKADLGINNAQYGVLQAAVSLVNTIVPLVGGRFIDTFGVSNGSAVSCTLIMLGGFLFALSAHLKSFVVMVAGRLLYGLGAMTVITVQHTILAHWFRGTALAVTVGVQIATSRLASFLATLMTVPIKNATGWYGYSFWAAFALCFTSWVIDIVYVIGMRRFYYDADAVAREGEGDDVAQGLLAASQPGSVGMSNSASSSSLAAGSARNPHPAAIAVNRGDAGVYSAAEVAAAKNKTRFQLDDVYLFPGTFWIIAGLSFTLGSSWTSFLHIAPEMIMHRFGQPETLAAFNASLSQLLPIFGAPFLGYLMDNRGLRPQLMVGASLALLASFGLLAWTLLPPYIALLLFSSSLTVGPVALVSSVGLLIGPESMGTALGIYKSMTNIASTLLDPLLGWLQDRTGGYGAPLIVLVAVTVASLCLSTGLWILDSAGDPMTRGLLAADGTRRPLILKRIEAQKLGRTDSHLGDGSDDEYDGDDSTVALGSESRPLSSSFSASDEARYGSVPVAGPPTMPVFWGRVMVGLMGFLMVLGWAVFIILFDARK